MANKTVDGGTTHQTKPTRWEHKDGGSLAIMGGRVLHQRDSDRINKVPSSAIMFDEIPLMFEGFDFEQAPKWVRDLVAEQTLIVLFRLFRRETKNHPLPSLEEILDYVSKPIDANPESLNKDFSVARKQRISSLEKARKNTKTMTKDEKLRLLAELQAELEDENN